MSVSTGDVVTQIFTTANPTTGAAADADSPPTGVLWLDGVADAATVTIADATGTGRYTFSVTMPTLTTGQRVAVVVAATIAGTVCAGEVWADQCAPAVNVTYSAGVALAGPLATQDHIDAALLAIQGGDGDTLETLSDQVDGLGATTLTVSSPVAENGDVELYAGDDYNNSDGRALEWSSSDWPDLTGATITLYLRAPDGSKFSKVGTAPVVGSGSQTVRVELTAAETATLIDWPTPSTLRLRATLAVSGRKVTLVTGVLTVAEDIS